MVDMLKLKDRGCTLYKRIYQGFFGGSLFTPVIKICWVSLCQRITNDFLYLCQLDGGFDIINYMDDLVAEETTCDKVEEEYQFLGTMLSECRVEGSVRKACSPHWLMVFLSVLFNTRALALNKNN